ncbi:hypothetical protein BDN72DRAFT_79572 [Pluteus cervinus]|uniref:Uncharacterized protein n=1 Tax=Pluteus cervinus TaxID=181527 RepID=A0ACD3B800_9AGAR|nr:hypothetical protein BDN72DRAFT_79572 [Pluteus cervinus]
MTHSCHNRILLLGLRTMTSFQYNITTIILDSPIQVILLTLLPSTVVQLVGFWEESCCLELLSESTLINSTLVLVLLTRSIKGQDRASRMPPKRWVLNEPTGNKFDLLPFWFRSRNERGSRYCTAQPRAESIGRQLFRHRTIQYVDPTHMRWIKGSYNAVAA